MVTADEIIYPRICAEGSGQGSDGNGLLCNDQKAPAVTPAPVVNTPTIAGADTNVSITFCAVNLFKKVEVH
jgi:hypothetical protein